ncbi:hypothetical protein J6590_073412 [Homalodisca vitripennis]|nr:hypothetical protein J6590_073412 [Homalodisca vitripennis]
MSEQSSLSVIGRTTRNSQHNRILRPFTNIPPFILFTASALKLLQIKHRTSGHPFFLPNKVTFPFPAAASVAREFSINITATWGLPHHALYSSILVIVISNLRVILKLRTAAQDD